MITLLHLMYVIGFIIATIAALLAYGYINYAIEEAVRRIPIPRFLKIRLYRST